ncbi:hypothetical protein Tco_0719047 [Tanacetum coccineum]
MAQVLVLSLEEASHEFGSQIPTNLEVVGSSLAEGMWEIYFVEDVRRVGKYRRMSRELRESVRRRHDYNGELKALGVVKMALRVRFLERM